MNRLLKYILIVNLVLIILWGLIVSLNVLHENYQEAYRAPPIFDEEGTPQVQEPPSSIYFEISYQLMLFSFFLLPVFVVFVSGLYQFKELNLKSYFKSLLVPLSYVIVGFILSIIWVTAFLEGEEGMIILFIWPQLIITFIAVAIVNLIVLFTGRKYKK